jgi:hypothetical protein
MIIPSSTKLLIYSKIFCNKLSENISTKLLNDDQLITTLQSDIFEFSIKNVIITLSVVFLFIALNSENEYKYYKLEKFDFYLKIKFFYEFFSFILVFAFIVLFKNVESVF